MALRQSKPITSAFKLAPTLARRVFQLREYRNFTVADLSKLSHFSRQRIEDIESGLETWLSVTDRQLLAKALTVEPALLQEVETHGVDKAGISPERADELARAILSGQRDLECPECRSTLRCSLQEGFDLEERPIQFAKAFCLKCPFTLR